MLDLTPEAQTDAHYWVSVLFAHVTVGLVLTALCGAMLRSAEKGAWLVLLFYAVGWEICVQKVGAGWADAAIDASAVGAGCVIAWAAWERRGSPLVVSMLLLLAVAWHGIRERLSHEKQN